MLFNGVKMVESKEEIKARQHKMSVDYYNNLELRTGGYKNGCEYRVNDDVKKIGELYQTCKKVLKELEEEYLPTP